MSPKHRSLLLGTAGTALVLSIATYFFISTSSPEVDPVSLAELQPKAPASSNQSITSSPIASGEDRPPLPLAEGLVMTKDDAPVTDWQRQYGSPKQYSSLPPAANYEEEIRKLANAQGVPEVTKAQNILDRMGSLPEEGKVFAMEQATQLIPDQNYNDLRPRLNKLATSPDLRESVMTDMLTRDDAVRMPALVELLRQPANPSQAEVREILAAYLDDQLGLQDIDSIDPTRLDAMVARLLAVNAQ